MKKNEAIPPKTMFVLFPADPSESLLSLLEVNGKISALPDPR
eukprot:CAMPEP_0204838074 /NCGR_PEP_ID=MMETSP1346-20131115/29804_1 /ASSEMBLY_ACC=CAM_ASM_000771 /TAXON_ID=215587 /ORGANISM="Aplanochytrium stocchinoi, Strain GSBS06" /LENGTH=41 /DNA_ID= /DNA_START= /DNA_END= /DNA_ORIENTATION=